MQERGAADRFARAVTRQAVAQAALAVGCKHSYTSVLDALTDLVQDFVQSVGLAAQAKAEAGGRTQVSTLDLVAALEEPAHQHDGRDRYELDWRSLRGFAFRDVNQSAERPEAFQWYQPFHTHIPPFPIPAGGAGGRKRPRPAGAEEEQQQQDQQHQRRRRRPAFVPTFLPAFPPEHTYRKTGIRATSKTEDPAAIQQHRIATKQLILKAMQRATGGSKPAASPGAEAGGGGGLGVRRGRSAGPVEDEEEEEDAGSVVSLPEAAAGAGAGVPKANGGGKTKKKKADAGDQMDVEEDEDLFNADAQPFKPVARESRSAATKPGGAVGGTRS